MDAFTKRGASPQPCLDPPGAPGLLAAGRPPCQERGISDRGNPPPSHPSMAPRALGCDRLIGVQPNLLPVPQSLPAMAGKEDQSSTP